MDFRAPWMSVKQNEPFGNRVVPAAAGPEPDPPGRHKEGARHGVHLEWPTGVPGLLSQAFLVSQETTRHPRSSKARPGSMC